MTCSQAAFAAMLDGTLALDEALAGGSAAIDGDAPAVQFVAGLLGPESAGT